MKRTTVFADGDDLATIKAAAQRLGVAEAEILREAIHLAALTHRQWEGPFFRRTYRPLGSGAGWEAESVLSEVAADASAAYEETKTARP